VRIPERTRGYLAIALAAVLFGVWPSLSKLVVNQVHPFVISFLIQFLPAVALLPSLRRLRIARSDWKLVLLSAVIGAVAGPIIYFYGLERTTASNSVFLSNSESMFTMLFAYAFLGERATRREYAALGGIAVGAFIVTTQLRFGDVQFLQFLIGNLMLVGAAVCWGVSNTTSTVLLRRIPIVALLEVQLLFGAAAFAAIIAATGTPVVVPLNILPVLILLAVSAVGVFSVLFFYAFRTIGAMRTGAVLPTSALWGILVALYLFPNETLSPIQVLGGALMVGALALFYISRGPSKAEAPGETLKPVASDGRDSP
jgi:drug/metabolite transporter (DMT)-like permease